MHHFITPFFCFLCLLPTNFLLAQQAKPKGLLLSTTATYRFDPDENLDGRFDYQDITWGLEAVAFISKNVRAGAATWQVFEKAGRSDWRQFFMAGPVCQFGLPIEKSIFVVGELGGAYGNFYPEPDGTLASRKGTYFGTLGMDVEWYWHRNFAAKFGWRYFPVLTKLPEKDNFVIYTVGVGYVLGKR